MDFILTLPVIHYEVYSELQTHRFKYKMTFSQLKPKYIYMIPKFLEDTLPQLSVLDIYKTLVSKFSNAKDETDFQNKYLMNSQFRNIKRIFCRHFSLERK